jgi:hypothetical protein
MVWNTQPSARRARRLALRVGAATLGAAGLSVGMVGVAGAQTPQTVNIAFTCTISVAGTSLPGQSVSGSFAVTAPSTVASGSPVSLAVTGGLSFPSTFAGEASALGITGVEETSASMVIGATGASPSSQTADAEGLPTTIPAADLGSPFTATLAPVSFTAGSPGTAAFSVTSAAMSVTLEGGSLAGDVANLTCSPNSGSPDLADVTVAAVSTTPVAAVGGAVLAGVLGVGAFGVYAVRRRRPSVEHTSY